MPVFLRRVLLSVVAVLAAYLIGANLFINTPLARDLVNRKPDRFQMSWSKGVTWFPGFVMLWDVQLKGHARKVQWQANAERAHGAINLFSLLRRELHSPWIRADGVKAAADLVAEDLLPMPHQPNAWSLHFRDIETPSLQQLRFGSTDISGAGSASAGFFKELRGGPMALLPSRLRFRDAIVHHDGEVALHGGDVDVDFAIPRHQRDEAPGMKKLAIASGRMKLDGSVPMSGLKRIGALKHVAQRWQGLVDSEHGDAHVSIDVGMTTAQLQSGSHVDIRAPLKGVATDPGAASIASLRAVLSGDDVDLSIQLPPPPQGNGSLAVALRIAGARLDPPRDLPSLLARSSGQVDIDWHFDALDWLDPLLPESGWLRLRGAGDVDARLRFSGGVIEPGSQLDIQRADLGVLVAEHRFEGSATASARVVGAIGTTPARLDVNVAADAYAVSADGERKPALLRGKDLRLALTTSNDIARMRETLAARLQFKRAEIPDVRVFNRYLPTASVVLTGGGNSLDGDVRLDSGGRVTRADVAMNGRGLRARLGDIPLAGNLDLAATLVASKRKPGHYDLDGSRLKVTRLVIGDGARVGGEPAWATLTLPRSAIKPGHPWTVDASADIRMENIRVLIGLFGQERTFPRWVAKLADAGVLQATGVMRSHGDSLVFDRVVASNDRFDAAARMRIRSGRPQGDLLLRWGALSVGLEVDGDQRDFKLVRAAHWYASKPDLLPAPTRNDNPRRP